jgi:urease accessory protein
VRARARLVAGAAGPGSAAVLRSEPPLVLRPAPDAVHLSQGAAGPLNGDDLELDVEVPAGRTLRLRAVAATLALPSRCIRPARIVLNAHVDKGARLDVLLEPVIVADGASVHVITRLDLAENAQLLWREEVVLGRYGEAGGEVTTRVDVGYAGRPLLRTGMALRGGDPVTHGPAVLGGQGLTRHRTVGTLLAVGFGSTGRRPEPSSAELSLPGPGTLFTVVASSALALRRELDGYLRALSQGAGAADATATEGATAAPAVLPTETPGADQPRRAPSQSRKVRA